MMIYGHTKMKNDINEIGRDVIDLQIKALKKLKNSINDTFGEAVQNNSLFLQELISHIGL